MKGWTVGLIVNLKQNVKVGLDAPPDALAEFDTPVTVDALEKALSSAGHEVIRLEGDETLLDSIRLTSPDICFNIAEGIRGDARESQVPALLELLDIPYTGSKILGHAISLDKAATKRIWRDSGLPTGAFQTFITGHEKLDPGLTYPLFVKPVHEGTGMGINKHSVVNHPKELRKQVQWVIDTYHQPALVEDYLPGREFTVGIIGNRLSPGEARWNGLYDQRGYHIFPVLEIDSNVGAGNGLYNYDAKSYQPTEGEAPLYLCPAPIPAPLERQLKRFAVAAFESIGALDLSRIDFRIGRDGRPYLMEINTLPGINPVVSDLCIMAQAEGMPYDQLIHEILNLAATRYAKAGKAIKGRNDRTALVPGLHPGLMEALPLGWQVNNAA